MSQRLGLAAYRALSWRKPAPASRCDVPRPPGELIWAHASGPERLDALCEFAVRLRTQRPGVRVLATLDRDRCEAPVRSGCDLVLCMTSDHPAAARPFLEHWRPDVVVWAGGNLMPNLINAASERGLPMVLLDIGAEEVSNRRHRWLPDLTRATLDRFDTILARDEAAAAAIRRIGLAPGKVSATARLRPGTSPPPCRETDLAAINRELGIRPIWLAAGVQAPEFEIVLAAHRDALRLVHRLLLVVAPADPDHADHLKRDLAATELRFADWRPGDPIGEETQMIVSSDPADLGLWYRIAPLSLSGSTFVHGPGGRSPFEAAALGAAVVHGPETRGFQTAFDSLAEAGAARKVADAGLLGRAVVDLVAPDRSARMALAGWRVATEGAELTDRVIDLVQDMLDLREATGAST
ncbi:MAG: 3-deoxy-D-manno-octulosonic acid transferase [Jhaorihella sp.]